MQELIDRKSALSICKEYGWVDDEDFVEGCNAAIKDISEAIRELPTIEAEPVRRGRWEYRHEDDWMFCTACGADAEGNYDEPLETDYCPHCGARMDGGAN